MTPLVLWMLRLGLAFPLLVAFFGKAIAGPARFREALRRYQIVPAFAHIPVSWAIIAAEGLAGILLLTPGVKTGAWLAALLGATFAGAVTWTIVRKQHVRCHCFGVLGDFEIGPVLLLLDLGMAAGGSLLALGLETPPTDAPASLTSAAITVATLVALTTAWALWAAACSRRRRMPPMGLPAGTPAPDFSVRSLTGRVVEAAEFYARPCLLLFVSPNCPRCESLLSCLAGCGLADTDTGLLIIGSGGRSAAQALAERFHLPPDFTVSDDDKPFLRTSFRIPGAPALVEVEQRRIQRTLLPATPEDLTQFLTSASHTTRKPIPLLS